MYLVCLYSVQPLFFLMLKLSTFWPFRALHFCQSAPLVGLFLGATLLSGTRYPKLILYYFLPQISQEP